jgi:hypothetical protein
LWLSLHGVVAADLMGVDLKLRSTVAGQTEASLVAEVQEIADPAIVALAQSSQGLYFPNS